MWRRLGPKRLLGLLKRNDKCNVIILRIEVLNLGISMCDKIISNQGPLFRAFKQNLTDSISEWSLLRCHLDDLTDAAHLDQVMPPELPPFADND